MIAQFSAKPSQEWTIGLTGMNARADNPGPGFAVARCIRHDRNFAGRLIGLGYDALDPGLHAEAVIDRGFLLPYPSEGPAALRERLDEIFAQTRFDAIIPSLDAELPNFIANEAWLRERGVRALLPTAHQLRRRDKDRLPELAAAAGVLTPSCRRIGDPSALERPEELDLAYPYVLKGSFYDAAIVHSVAEARAAFHKLAALWGYPILAQPFIAGYEVNLCGLADAAGELVGHVSMRKRALTDKNKAWAGVSIVDPQLEDMARRLVAELGWRGPFEVEALRDAEGALHLIEINPRFPAWAYLTAGAEYNLPQALLHLLEGRACALPLQAVAGRCFIRFADEVVLNLAQMEAISLFGDTGRNDRAKAFLSAAM
ncbi:ATP-grasp domain-containing protein [uncultured Rhodoblastus sp.]|uniref:ATP-grasp domain-containing protein n=1 Tax=uncultured Rhodoblastus sp. TaxID=543037 RepID=UPI0025DA2530|nr:ATP-grasp domain-containing protein [uncultured Rhodoblastus sp.]